MSIVTLKRFLDAAEAETATRNSISLLLNAAVEHAVQLDPQEHENLREDVHNLRRITTSDAEWTLEEFLVSMGAAANAIQNYNSRTTRGIRKQSAELRNIIAMLTQAVVTIAGSATQSAKALENIKTGLSNAAAIEDIQTLRHRLGDCLNLVCDEVSRQKTASQSMIVELQTYIQNAKQCVIEIPELDHATGLPLRPAAEAAFVEALSRRQKSFVVTVVMDRLQSINARFGHNVGDQVLRALRSHIELALVRKEDRLFRWTGPSIVVLMQRDLELNQVRSAVRRALEVTGQQEFDVGGRKVLIPMAVAWSAIALIPPAENAPKYVERFVASQVPRDFA